MKPALMITKVWAVPIDLIDATATADFQQARIFLLLSQDNDLNPGQVLHVATLLGAKSGNANEHGGWSLTQHGDKIAGRIWAPSFVGFFSTFTSTIDSMDWRMYLEFEQVDVPFWDWFMLWDHIDRVPDLQEEI